jgi:hypothetical protein
MKVQCLAVVAIIALASAHTAQARQVDPGGKIEVPCAQTRAVRMATIDRAVENSHYWASQATRREMLALARQACERGATVVRFVPPADQRFAPEDAEVADTAPRINRVGA